MRRTKQMMFNDASRALEQRCDAVRTLPLDELRGFIRTHQLTIDGMPVKTNTGGPMRRTKKMMCDDVQRSLQASFDALTPTA